MSEQKDLERAAFEDCIIPAWSLEKRRDSDGDTVYVEDWVQGAWIGWQKARSLPVGVPDGYALVPVSATREQKNSVCMHPDLAAVLYSNMVKAAPAVKAEQVRYSAEELQKEALTAGLQYVREPDDHYVTGTTEQALDFIRNMIGVDIRLTDKAPSLPAAGSAEWIDHGPSKACPFSSPYTSKVDVRLRDGRERLGDLACNTMWFWYEHDPKPYDVVAYRIAALSAHVSVPRLNKTREQWHKLDAKFCAESNSSAANFYLIRDAQQDIERLHRALLNGGEA